MLENVSETRKIVLLGVLSALGAALMYIEIPITLFNFLRIDLSDVVVLITFMLFGFKEAILVAFIKSFMHFLFPGSNPTYGIGEIAAFLASATYVSSYYLATIKLKLNVVYSSILSILIMSIVLTFLNWLIIAPVYYIFLYSSSYPNLLNGAYIYSIVSVFFPFNLIKGVVVFGVFFGVKKSLIKYYENN